MKRSFESEARRFILRSLAKQTKAENSPPPPRSSEESAPPNVRLLEAALDLFGQRGFGETSVRDLALAANVNQAAVNYYFGGKEKLRMEALRFGFAPTVEIAAQMTYLAEEAVRANTQAAAEEALHRSIRIFLEQILRHDGKHWTMFLREQLTPGPAFEMLVRDYIEPLGRGLHMLVEQLLPGAEPIQAGLCVRSIVGQCVHLRYATGLVKYFSGKDPSGPEFLDGSARHIAEFSICALRGLRGGYRPIEDLPRYTDEYFR